MAINPMEREDCWLCAGSGEIETRKADESYEDVTVGCPACLQNDLEWQREKVERERDALAAHAERQSKIIFDALAAIEDGDVNAAPFGEARAAHNETPMTSLARLKARWQADVLWEFTHGSYVMPATVNLAMSERAKELNRQAKGEG